MVNKGWGQAAENQLVESLQLDIPFNLLTPIYGKERILLGVSPVLRNGS
jgi:hypothetical protein